jgi:NADPH:quinone reductase-like Zn-dependent oxidoreductase
VPPLGTYAVQLAHLYGAHVIATASWRNATFLHDLGANEVMDYISNHFEQKLHDVDVVLDTVGGDTLERSWGVLTE